MPRTTGLTRADATMLRLRNDILNGHVEPGSKLGFADLGERYQVSTGVLREVLPRLVEQGLATSESQLGYRVVSVSVEDLEQLTRARIAIETMVLRQATGVGDVSWESDVVAAHHALARTPRYVDGDLNQEWMTLHDRFHLVLLQGCGNPYLTDVAAKLRSIFDVYRCWSRAGEVSSPRDVEGEHRMIAEAAVARDADACDRLITAHIQLTTDLFISTRNEDATVGS
ncbi:GntR family transcriptional regulator [Nocardioides sp. 503]|uniref:GntR family transcriptional regulator n=1 Tax=Nocardioides sp. 503 TaxID=2508326 RepID=UPI00106F889E|nr:GntR family transcriptional regulator [Nocardioides sp. 503]